MSIVTLTTDFGTRDVYVGAMKGIILGYAPQTQLVDLSHAIKPQDVMAGQLVLDQARKSFPPRTIHLAVIDPGVGTERKSIIVEAGNQLFVGPDNGLFSFVLREADTKFWTINEEEGAPHPSATFHGRDLFAPVAGKLAAGRSPQELGEPQDEIQDLPFPTPKVIGDVTEGEVVGVDHFGNLVTNVVGPGKVSDTRVEIAGTDVGSVRRVYAEVNPGEVLALWNSDNRLEIAVRNGSARQVLGVGRGTKVKIRYA